MADLIAQGQQTDQRWRRPLVVGSVVTVGRSNSDWNVPWDDRISRQHVQIQVTAEDRIEIQQLPTARNPIFFRGIKRESFSLGPGEHFVVGRTTFTLAPRPIVADSPTLDPGVTQHVFAPSQLRTRVYRDAASRIEVLSRLPELISSSTNDSELLVRVTGVLMQATPTATAVAILQVNPEQSSNIPSQSNGSPESTSTAVKVLHYDHRSSNSNGPRPSGRIAREAVQNGESVLHLWGNSANPDPEESLASSRVNFTANENVDWAFAVPVPSEACPGWVLYLTGHLPQDAKEPTQPESKAAVRNYAPAELQDDLKFTELVATTLGNLRQMRQLQKRQAGLSRFFAPVVLQALSGRDPLEVLAPREAAISVLFCDLRGFSRRSEEQADQLMELLNRVSAALGIMTHQILRRDGVIGDFHGDAAMGFWGWPLPNDNKPQQACLTALDILADFHHHSTQEESLLGGFRCGIGIATGRAVAGRIGTNDQVKVTAFGPVVNLASRLEGMTKLFAAEILIDETTANYVRLHVPQSLARVRRLARVRPYGMQAPILVHQLLPPATTPGAPSDQDITNYERALDCLLAARWDQAFELLHNVPASDRAKDFLTVFIASHGRTPPEHWDGVITLPSK